MTVHEAVGRLRSAWYREPRAEERPGRSVASTRFWFLVFHLLFAAYWFVGRPNLPGALLVWFALQFGVFAGYHRYFAHRSYKTHPWFEGLLALLGCLAFQGGLLWWVSEHRHHHRTADTDEDFHSPRDGFWHAHMGWLLRNGIDDRVKWDLIPDLRRPILFWIERNEVLIKLAYAGALALAFGWYGVLTYWVVPVVLCWHTSLATNSFCHAFGSHPAECPPRGSCAARNNAVVALLNLGEGWHNNHHTHPSYAHHGFHRWYQLDVIYLVLLALEKLGIVWDVKRRPKRARDRHLPLGVEAA
jgi:stearoyl-CoA desaturase (delta-9 desaturase)